MRILYALVVAEAAFAVGVVFVIALRDGDLVRAVTLGAALFSLLVVMMLAIREQAL